MKRVLERAKQNQLQSAGLPTSTSSGGLQVQAPMGVRRPSSNPSSPSSPRDGRPLKIPRRNDDGAEVSSSTANASVAAPAMSAMISDGNNEDVRRRADAVLSANNARNAAKSKVVAPATTSSASSSSMKRQRTSVTSKNTVPYPQPSDDEDESQQTSFFLKHQNRALASELKALQYQLSLLENERFYRRKQCRIASQSLNSLQATWTQMETELQQNPQHALNAGLPGRDTSSFVEDDAPMSTGSGNRVEIMGALFDALSSLATLSPSAAASRRNQENGEVDEEEEGEMTTRSSAQDLDPIEKQQLDDLSNISWNILQRANTLEQWIRSTLQKLTDGQGGEGMQTSTADQRALNKEIGVLRGQCREYKIQIAELAKAREDTAKSERKVRRAIYRLSTGRVKIEQVLKDMEKSDEDGTLAAEAKMEAMADEHGIGSSSSQNAVSSSGAQDGVKQEPGAADSVDVQQMRKRVEELESLMATRDTSIEELQSRLTESEQRINTLSARELSEEDSEKVQLHQKTAKQLEQVEQELADVKEKLKETRDSWAKARGDADTALKALDDMQTKQKKRWAELTAVNGDAEGTEINLPINIEPIEQAKQIIELDHKLKQALENVRQADAVRQNLKEALAMNSAVQGKLDEVKGKYAALQANRSSSSNSKSSSSDNNHGSSEKREKSESSSKSEKQHREHRRMRKELAAMSASKDAAKAKLERVEKERENLTETNARLLRQSAEKDDMNAKSLSTILHLKNLTEQLQQGKLSLEQQLKSAGQLSLAARLATNAKDKVAKEIVKEKEATEKKLKDCEQRNEALKRELESTVSEWSEADAKISILNSQLTKSTKRSDELVLELEKEQKERRKLQDSLDDAVRKAGDAADKLNQLSKQVGNSGGGGGGVGASGFTVDQLNTQVSVLKNRLACPVCHYRDKTCIIMRCRHMFCRHCVDENIANRSRKCPSCGLKFSERDVEDVWL